MHSDEGAIMDGQDEFDHGVIPIDPKCHVIQEKIRLVLLFNQGYQAC